MGNDLVGKQSGVMAGSSRIASHDVAPTPGKSTLAQDYPAEQVQAPIAVAQEIMLRGAPAEDVARIIAMQPQYASAIIMIAQQFRGNAYSQQIVKAVQAAHPVPIEDPGKDVEDNVASRNKGADPVLIGLAQRRVGSAHTEWSGALSDVYTDISTESDSELKMFPAIALNVFAGFLSLGMQSAIAYIAERGLEASAKAIGGAGVKVAEELSDTADSSLEVMVGSVIDQGKDMAKAPVNTITTNTKGEKGEKKEFLTALNRSMLHMFTSFGESVALHSTNKQLVELCVTFDPNKWTRDRLQAQIAARLKEFSGSRAANIGRKNANAASRDGEKSEALEHTQRETGVAWLKTADTPMMKGTGRKLIYVIQDFENEDQDPMALDYGITGVAAYKNAPMLSLGDEAHDGLGNKHKLKPTGRPAYAGDVEPNLVEIAIDYHKETWQQDPPTYDVGMILFGANAFNTHATEPEGKGAE